MENEETLDIDLLFQSRFVSSTNVDEQFTLSGHYPPAKNSGDDDNDDDDDDDGKDDNDDDDADQTRNWSEWGKLPEVVLVHVLSFLKDSDRLSMCLVCHSWAHAFDHPCLWRTRVYNFGSVMGNLNEGKRAIGFALRHGKHLQQLTIRCHHPTYGTCKKFQRTMTTFLHLLGRTAKLRKLSVAQLFAERYWRYDTLRSKLFVSMSHFLKGQRNLEAVNFSDALFSVHNGLKVLEALGRAAGRNMRLFIMEDFFVSKLAVFRIGRYRVAMKNFRFLTTLHTNYSYLSDEIIDTLTHCCARNLQLLSIKVFRHDPHFHIIGNDMWCSLRRACPLLKVALFFEGLGEHGDLMRILKREIPLKTLQVWTGVPTIGEHLHLSQTLINIAEHYHNTLEEMWLSIENGSESIDEAVIFFLRRAKRLEDFDLRASLQVETVEQIYQLQRDYTIGLLKCRICMESLTGIEVDDLQEINARYSGMVFDRGLLFSIDVSDFPFI